MNKRAHYKLNGGEDVEGSSRHKRRRETRGPSSDVDIMMSDPAEPKGEAREFSRAEVKEMGLKILQTVLDAVKDGRLLSGPFVHKPPKQAYPDYYLIIQQPIALDDIKKHLNKGKYATPEDVKNDFELLFNNAKQYNRSDSDIYQDAKDLLKLVHKTYSKFVPEEEDDDKSKPQNLYRLLRTRLDKLVSKKDPNDGRAISVEFMQLPSKKLWPIYYHEIKDPRCFDDIYRSLKQTEYHSAAEFAADVELIFSNAVTFNQDGTQIFNDAVTLRDYFRQLMSDLPMPYTLPEYAKPANKIRIRPVHATQPATSGSSRPATKQEQPTSTPLTLKVPPAQPSTTTQAATLSSQTQVQSSSSVVNTLPVAPVTAQRAAAPKASAAQAQPAPKSATPQPTQPASFINASASHYPKSQIPYIPPPVTTSIVASTPPVLRASSVVNTSQRQSETTPQVVYPLSRQLKSVNIQIQPKTRRLTLDHRDAVKSWSVRLVPGETSLIVNEVTYMEEEEEESSGDEHGDVEKEEEDDYMDVDHEPSKETRKKGKSRGRGRPPKAVLAAKAAAAAKAAKAVKKKVARKPVEVQLKLNNLVVTEQPEKPGEWSVYLVTGNNVVEIGEADGMIWKLYAERMPEA